MAQGRKKRRAPWKLILVGVLAVVAVSLSALALARTSGGGTASTAAPAVYAVGDSITEGNSPDFAHGNYGDGSWVSHLDPRINVVGGWARGGATTNDMARNVSAAPAANTLIMLAGSNDVANQLPFPMTKANLERIATVVGADRVIVSAIPPRDLDPRSASEFNRELQALADANGWQFIDPTGNIRNGDVYAPGMTSDGIHPTPRAAELLGRNISAAVL